MLSPGLAQLLLILSLLHSMEASTSFREAPQSPLECAVYVDILNPNQFILNYYFF